MKRKMIPILLLCVFLLSACACEHDWIDANCTTAKTCSKCEETEGEALGHTWQDATCEAPKTCSACGVTEGEALAHTWQDATCETPKTCSVCAATEGDVLAHDWVDATCNAPKTCSMCAATKGDKLPHSWIPATKDAPKTCENCGETRGEPLSDSSGSTISGSKNFGDSATCASLTAIFEEDFADYSPLCGYDEDSNTYMVVLTAPEGTTVGLYYYADEMRADWTELGNNLNVLSATAYGLIVNEGYDADCVIILLSDLDDEVFLFASQNGETILDILEEL